MLSSGKNNQMHILPKQVGGSSGKGEEMLKFVIPIILIILVVAVILLSYVKAPPDKAFIISGLQKKPRILIGRAGIRLPFLERLDTLYLGQMSVDIKTEQSVPTNDFINVNVDAVAKVRIQPDDEGIALASKNFLNKRLPDIAKDLQDSLQEVCRNQGIM